MVNCFRDLFKRSGKLAGCTPRERAERFGSDGSASRACFVDELTKGIEEGVTTLKRAMRTNYMGRSVGIIWAGFIDFSN
jgi:hypothetical protein